MDESPDIYPLALHEHSWPDYTYHMGQSFCKYNNDSQITNIQFSWFKSVPNDFSLVVNKTMIMVITS